MERSRQHRYRGSTLANMPQWVVTELRSEGYPIPESFNGVPNDSPRFSSTQIAINKREQARLDAEDGPAKIRRIAASKRSLRKRGS